MEFKPIENQTAEFWEGKQNLFVRLVTYAKVGLAQVNDYKYIGAAIFGVYFTLKLTNPWWLALMTVISIPILVIIGRWWLHKGAKASEYVTTQKGTVLGYGAYNVAVEQTELLKQINKKL